jgi:hypothetical protein
MNFDGRIDEGFRECPLNQLEVIVLLRAAVSRGGRVL